MGQEKFFNEQLSFSHAECFTYVTPVTRRNIRVKRGARATLSLAFPGPATLGKDWRLTQIRGCSYMYYVMQYRYLTTKVLAR